ncbi:methionyl-tRNA formyltransferase [Methylocella sp.]|uniref:methionyl-tRNA formyltransferase n=1 Tax=Methylocella sp. TaxID=1978226 RepID=UPI0037846FBF
MGTPEFSVPVLTELVGHGHEIAAVYTRAPKPAGRRGLDLVPSPVHQAALRFGLRVETPANFRSDETVAALEALDAEAAVVVAYGLILPKRVLDLFPHGCLNLHASLLPRWRGAAPIQRAIMAGDAETGVMVMKMEEGLDTGPVGLVERVAIAPGTTAGELHDALSRAAADLSGRALAALGRGGLVFTPQAEDGVLYAAKIDKGETRVDWRESAETLHDRIRGLSPFPGAWFEADFGKGPERVKIFRATPTSGEGAPGLALDAAPTIACGRGALRLEELQRAGRGVMSAEEFSRGSPLPAGARLPCP